MTKREFQEAFPSTSLLNDETAFGNSGKIWNLLNDLVPKNNRTTDKKDGSNFYVEGPTNDGRFITVSNKVNVGFFDTQRSILVHIKGFNF